MQFQLSYIDVMNIALGTGFLGSGGGGDTRICELITIETINEGCEINVVSIDQVIDDDMIVAVGVVGAPTVLSEKLPSANEGVNAVIQMEAFLGRKITKLIPVEIGGMNGVYAIYIASQLKTPIIDADCMGRAFPEIQMVTPNIYGGIQSCVAVLANGQEQHTITAANLAELEQIVRLKIVEMGGIATLACLPMQGKDVRELCVHNSISVAKKIGQELRGNNSLSFIESLNRSLQGTLYGPAKVLITGEIVDLDRNLKRGFNKGSVIIADHTAQQLIKIEFQNENLSAIDVATGQALALVPEIITIVDNEFKPLSCEVLRVGLKVSVLSLEVPPILCSDKALEIIGPKAFSLNNYSQEDVRPEFAAMK